MDYDFIIFILSVIVAFFYTFLAIKLLYKLLTKKFNNEEILKITNNSKEKEKLKNTDYKNINYIKIFIIAFFGCLLANFIYSDLYYTIKYIECKNEYIFTEGISIDDFMEFKKSIKFLNNFPNQLINEFLGTDYKKEFFKYYCK